MEEQVSTIPAEETVEVIDGRTTLGKIQAKLKELENIQEEHFKILVEHGKKIDECSVRR
jgi:phosphosulfolactate synthase (CoM biosynthesis protein A)